MMNVIIDIVKNSISITRPISKKVEPFNLTQKFEFPLTDVSNIVEALNFILNEELILELKEEKSNSLLLSDDQVAFGLEELPVLSKSKLGDIFDTRFKMYFPDYKNYYANGFEFERNNTHVLYIYSLARRDNLDKILAVFKSKEIQFKSIDYFASNYTKNIIGFNEFPIATLIIGDEMSEIFISKGKEVCSISFLPIGKRMLMNGNNYLTSAYNLNNNESLKFSACVKANYAGNITFTDEKILSYTEEEGLSFSIPREVRAIKGTSLENYNLKNNFRKFTSMVGDYLDIYSRAPYFMPVSEVRTYADEDLFEHLNASAENSFFKYNEIKISLDMLNEMNIEHNSLFSQKFKEERRRIDWAKFLTMEIGKKKKA